MIQKKLRRLRVPHVAVNIPHRLVDVPVSDREVERAIEIDVEEGTAEAERVARGKSDPRGHGNIVVDSRPRGAIQADHLVVEIRDGNSRPPRIFEVADIHTHPGACLAFRAERQSRVHRRILEFSVAKISVEFVRLRVVGHQQIGPAVLVVVDHRHAQ